MTATALADAYLRSILRTYRMYKDLGERAIAQVSTDADLHRQIDPESNSIAVIVKHVAGNLRSRFRDFLTTDGEKPDRNRDAEFEMTDNVSRAEVLRWWNDGWGAVLEAIEALRPEDLERTVTIRREEFLVVEALNRSVTHTAYHVGQIVYVARHLAGASWTSLSIPKGRSAEAGVGTYKSGASSR
ncbi:MAG: DUF1572 family protein [Gemmatimonadaceae bacterium]